MTSGPTAPEDATPPVETRRTRSPAQVDTSTGEKYIDVAVTATDDLSGVKTGAVNFKSRRRSNGVGDDVWPDGAGGCDAASGDETHALARAGRHLHRREVHRRRGYRHR